MRYERVEECSNPECENTFHCTICNSKGWEESREIRTPVEHTELWAVYDGNDKPIQFGLTEQSTIEKAVNNPDIIAGSSEYYNGHAVLPLGYTCEQIHVIRRNHE